MGTLKKANFSSFKQRAMLGMLLFVLLLWMASCDSQSQTAVPAGQNSPATGTAGVGVGTMVAGTQVAASAATVTVATTTAATTTTAASAVATTAAAATPNVPGVSGTTTQDVPNPPNSKPADVGNPLEKRFTSQLLSNTASSSSIRFFATGSSFEDIVKYYDKALGDAGYRKQGLQQVTSIGNLRVPDGAIAGYAQDGKRVAIVNAGVVNDNFIAQLSSAELTAENLRQGDRLIIILENVPAGLGSVSESPAD